MSWIDKIQTDFVIVTGDKRSFRPNWIRATKAKEFNIAEFDFPDKAGTLVQRGTPRGKKYELEIYFQGENHLEISEEFDNSSDDQRPWTITHPFYGSLIVHPVGLFFDNTSYNVSKITGTVFETITENNPKISINPVDKILLDKENMDNIFAVSFAAKHIPGPDDIVYMTKNNATIYNEGKRKIKLTIDAEAYFNLFKSANTYVLNATADPLAAIREVQAMISYPFILADSVQNRIGLLASQFNLLRRSISSLNTPTLKATFENNAGLIIGTMAAAAAVPNGEEYGNRADVLAIIDQVVGTYNTYLTDLDSLQSTNGGKRESYIPDFNSLNALHGLVNYTVANLFSIAIGAKQERTILIEDDTNIIILTHRFYGLDADDKIMNDMIRNNKIGLSELLTIKKGRKIVYYK